MMGLWIESVVNGDAFAGSHLAISGCHRRSASVSQNQVDPLQRLAKGMAGLLPQFVQSGGGIHVPIDLQGPRSGGGEKAFQKFVVIDADATGLHRYVSIARFSQSRLQAFSGCRPDQNAGPVRWINVPMLLAVEGVWFAEYDFMAVGSKRVKNPPVIRRCSVPVGREQT